MKFDKKKGPKRSLCEQMLAERMSHSWS